MFNMTNDQKLLRSLLAGIPQEALIDLLFRHVSPPVTCDGCGKSVAADDATNIIIPVKPLIGSPPHPGIPPFQCPAEEHWACSAECFEKVAMKCIQEHITPLVRAMYEKLGVKQ